MATATAERVRYEPVTDDPFEEETDPKVLRERLDRADDEVLRLRRELAATERARAIWEQSSKDMARFAAYTAQYETTKRTVREACVFCGTGAEVTDRGPIELQAGTGNYAHEKCLSDELRRQEAMDLSDYE